jgi:hypothetical protein
MTVGAIVFYLIGEALIYYGAEWLASTRVVQSCKVLLHYIKPIVKAVSSTIGSVINVFWNWYQGI